MTVTDALVMLGAATEAHPLFALARAFKGQGKGETGPAADEPDEILLARDAYRREFRAGVPEPFAHDLAAIQGALSARSPLEA